MATGLEFRRVLFRSYVSATVGQIIGFKFPGSLVVATVIEPPSAAGAASFSAPSVSLLVLLAFPSLLSPPPPQAASASKRIAATKNNNFFLIEKIPPFFKKIYYLTLGSSASRNPSPKKLIHKIVIKIANPAGTQIHGLNCNTMIDVAS